MRSWTTVKCTFNILHPSLNDGDYDEDNETRNPAEDKRRYQKYTKDIEDQVDKNLAKDRDKKEEKRNEEDEARNEKEKYGNNDVENADDL